MLISQAFAQALLKSLVKKIIIVTPNFQTEFEEAHTETFTSPCIVTKEAVNQDVVLALSC